MSYLFDYGEFLICFGPTFLIITAVFLLLLKNSWPSKESRKSKAESSESQGEQEKG